MITNEQMYEIKQLKAINLFKQIINPILKSNNINVINVEDTSLCKSQSIIDHGTGIDGILIVHKYHQIDIEYPVSLRIQIVDHMWNTYTIRYSRSNGMITEYDKLKMRMSVPGAMYPYWHIQSYVNFSTGEITIGICRIHNLVHLIETDKCRFNIIKNESNDISTFAIIDFDDENLKGKSRVIYSNISSAKDETSS